ncbi:MAG TPA: extracellular solute-binding protein [Lachnospiraceae bacterium]|nr:extracellular solute-binding protein [Lachnospiraceae bacterium]
MKSKSVKKFLAAVLTTVMAASVVGCGDSKPVTTPSTDAVPSSTTEESTAATTVDEVGQYTVLTDADGNVYDLGGMEIIIRDWFATDPAEPTNDYEEARDAYREWIQETYNFTIKEQAISSWSDVPGDFVNYATAGGEENYVFTLYPSGDVVSAMKSGLAYDLSTLDCLDYSEAKWGSKVHDLYNFDGKIYAMRGIEPEPRCGVFFNKRLLTEAGINPEDIYAWQEDGSWTWEKFEEVLKSVQDDTDNDGIIDRYAMCEQDVVLYDAAVYSNGGEYVGKEDGKYVLKVENDETMEAINWAVNLRKNYEMKYPEDASWDYFITAFKNGEAAFNVAQAYNANPGQPYNDMEDDFGYVCFPKGPNMTDYTNCYSDNMYMIPACYDADKAWKIAFAYNLYTDPIPGYEDYAAWKSQYYKGFRDTEAVDLTLQRMVTNGSITFQSFIPAMNLGNDFYWTLSDDITPAKALETIKPTWQAYIDEANK